MSGTKPFVLRSIYQELTGDTSSLRNYIMKNGLISVWRKQYWFQRLWHRCWYEGAEWRPQNKVQRVLAKVLWVSFKVHSSAWQKAWRGLLAKAISVHDLKAEVSKRCPPETPIPSESWIRLNFEPRNPRAKVSEHYSGKFTNVYFKGIIRTNTIVLLFFDIKESLQWSFKVIPLLCAWMTNTRLKLVNPLAAAEHAVGRCYCLIATHMSLVIITLDHDFTRFSVIPSVVLEVNSFEGSWYTGQVFVAINDSVHEASSPGAELHSKLLARMAINCSVNIFRWWTRSSVIVCICPALTHCSF